MSHPEPETLVDLALGDDGEVDVAQRAHVRECPVCSATVASLVRTGRLLGGVEPDLVAPAGPPAGLWERIEAAVDEQELIDLEAAQVADADDAPIADDVRRGRRRPRVPWLVGVAAAGLVIGLAAGRAVWRQTSDAPPPADIARVQLTTLDTKRPLGDAVLLSTGSGLDLRVSTPPLDPRGGYLEVWLINTDGKRMLSVGILPNQGAQIYPVSQAALDAGYRVVDVSREQFDDKPQHSGDSLARGTLPA
jgi:hypothetical protein